MVVYTPTPETNPLPPWYNTSGIPPDPQDNNAGTANPDGGNAPVPTVTCPPGYTPSNVPGATPGSCTDAQGHVVSPDAFWLNQNTDSRYTPAQWQTWINLGKYDPTTHLFRSERTGPNGEVLDAWVAKPVDCPDRMTAFGSGKCLDEGDPRLTGGSIGGPAPVVAAVGKPVSQLQYTKSPLQNALVDMFNTRAGLFGEKNPFLSGVTSRAPKTDDISGMFLPGGGLWWGGSNSLQQALAPYAGGFATVPDAAAPISSVAPVGEPVPKPVVNPILRPPLPPKKRMGPLQTAFAQSGISF